MMNSIYMRSQYEPVDIKRQHPEGGAYIEIVNGPNMLISSYRGAVDPQNVDTNPQPLRWRADVEDKEFASELPVGSNQKLPIKDVIQEEDLIFREGSSSPDFVITNVLNAKNTPVLQLELDSRD